MPNDYADTEPKMNFTFGADDKPDISITKMPDTFPTGTDAKRIQQYEHFERLFFGNHYEAFNIKVSDKEYNKAYSMLRYVTVNFAGMISRIVADMLFGEPVKIIVPNGDQAFVEGLWRENNLDLQCYESALSNSYKGDALFKLRLDRRYPKDKTSTVIIEDTTPNIYYPTVNDFNVRQQPETETLAWKFSIGGVNYLRQEIHTPGQIENKIFKMKGNQIDTQQPLSLIDEGLVDVQKTGVDFNLLEHVVNWKAGSLYFGISDYFDLETLFFAINNRMSKVDNVLDKHTDPILLVPPGILDENGKVRKQDIGVMEVQEGETGKPEYIVWDASLENAFKEIEKLVEFMYMVGEVSPDVLGMGQGVSDSGRALKFKLMRTIAKVSRKKLYYDMAIKHVLYKAQVFAKVHGVKVDGKTLQGEPVMPEIEWADGLPTDMTEKLDEEIKAVDAGLKSKLGAIQTLYAMDEASAREMLEEKRKETQVDMPKMNPTANPFDKAKNNDKPNENKQPVK